MPEFAEVVHREWIAASCELVRAQFGDVRHHIAANVHPKLDFELLSEAPGRARFAQEVRLLGIRQRDVFERVWRDDGSIEDTSVDGFNRGGTVRFMFNPRKRDGREGTEVTIVIRLPLPRFGRMLRPLLQAQLRREVRAAALEDKLDIETRGYPAAAGGSVSHTSAPDRAGTAAA
jgi:hypothetical protein